MKHINNTANKIITILLFSLFSSLTFAADAVVQSARMEMIGSMYTLATIVASALGILLIILSLKKMKDNAENPNTPKNFPSSIIITMLAGVMLFNYSGTADTFISSLLGDDAGYCMLSMDSKLHSEVVRDNCFDVNSSEVMSATAKKIESVNGAGAAQTFRENIETIIAFLQFVGFVYFIKAVYALKQQSEGQGKEGYGKIIGTMIMATLFVDLPHTMEMGHETIKVLGYG